MSIPDYQTLMTPVLELAAQGETSIPAAAQAIAMRFGLSAEEQEQLMPSGRQRLLHNRLHWAKFYLSKAGLLESPRRGRFAATEAGRALLAAPPPRLDNAFLLSIPAFRAFHRGDDAADEAPSPLATASIPVAPAEAAATPEDAIDGAYRILHASLRAELLERILQNGPDFFEQVIVELLVAMGYGGSRRNAAERLGRSGDGGVDGVINEDVLGLDRVYIQAKRYAPGNTVGRPEVQAFTGSLVGLGASKGVFVTTSGFSAQAAEYAGRIPQRVVLIDGQQLAALMVEHSVGVRISRVIEFKRLDEDFFSDE
ncbi:restriction endonuclease [Roseomonas sp. GC11]|uniref:restriction endonuclease n=1 Tax=Roseomonas sp. GC11 TaxID=2950546 RepID=UPI00210E0398|nr:restriction endonuclease [Roseomonas sp. GC11]MCQ4163067.1 restriction endonuclease [Roseomonas sp. GC11]